MITHVQRIAIEAMIDILTTFKQQDKIDVKLAVVLTMHAQFLEFESTRLST